MTNGISIKDMVQIKASGEIGRVVAIDDHTDRLPADLQVALNGLGFDAFDPSQSLPDTGLVKYRVDEVCRIPDIDLQ